jgi:hypothetical protein
MSRSSLSFGMNGFITYGLDTPWLGRRSGNRIRFFHEVVGRLYATDTRPAYDRYRLIERHSSLHLASHVAGRDRLRGMDRYWGSGYGDCGNSFSRRFCCAHENIVHWPHSGRRYWAEARPGKLRDNK